MVDRLQPPQPEWECLRVGPGMGVVMRRTPLLQPSHWVGPNGRLYALDPTAQGHLGAFWEEEGAAGEPAAVARLNKLSNRLTPGERATHLRPLPAQRHVAQEQAQGLEQGGARAEEWLLGPWAHLQLDPQVWGVGTTTLLDFSVKHARVRLHQLQRVSADPLYPPCGGLWPALWGVRPPRAAGEPEVAVVADGALRELELKWEASAQQVADQGAAGGAHQRPSPQMRAAQQAERQLEAQERRGGRQPVAQPAPRADTVDQLAVGDQAGQPCAKVWKELLDPTLRQEHVIVAWRVLHASLMVGALWGHILKGAAAPGSFACRFCQPGHLETLTHAFLTCPAVVPAWEWVLDVYGRVTGARPLLGDAMLLLSGRPTRGEAPPFQPPDSLLWLRLRVAYLGAVWRLRSSGAATALQPQQVARRVVEEVISTLTTTVKRDRHRVGRDIRVGLCGAVPSTWFKGKDPELDAAHFDQLWPEAPTLRDFWPDIDIATTCPNLMADYDVFDDAELELNAMDTEGGTANHPAPGGPGATGGSGLGSSGGGSQAGEGQAAAAAAAGPGGPGPSTSQPGENQVSGFRAVMPNPNMWRMDDVEKGRNVKMFLREVTRWAAVARVPMIDALQLHVADPLKEALFAIAEQAKAERRLMTEEDMEKMFLDLVGADTIQVQHTAMKRLINRDGGFRRIGDMRRPNWTGSWGRTVGAVELAHLVAEAVVVAAEVAVALAVMAAQLGVVAVQHAAHQS
ncbi:hypothetical protein QJQ45_008752 [Haematococcus lacustris]|nr:hypothetical protein QJQ45_008752 [Haematococcus lacustris]